ncbi:MAG: hypothetical protein KA440_11745 [Azonexus sp.]|jgi:hypothetical protein|nr:hypothetical protein [Azonexus sp.]
MNDFGINTDPPVTIMTLGQVPVMILTNVYRNPDAVRMFAMSQRTWTQGKGLYPGHFLFTPVTTQFFCPFFSKHMGLRVRPHAEYQFAPFARIEGGNDFQDKENTPHIDDFCDYVGVLSLSTTEDIPSSAVCGTSFWRHVPTGAEIAPDSESVSQFFTTPDSSWEQTGLVQHRYNQLVIFSARAFHRIDLSGAGPRAIRLTQNFYLITCGEV